MIYREADSLHRGCFASRSHGAIRSRRESGRQRFLVNTLVEQNARSPVTVVMNWTADLKKWR